jgi:hypothetical protein
MSSFVTITPGRLGSRGTPLGAFFSSVARLCRTKSDTTFPIVCFPAMAIDRVAPRTSSSRSNVVLTPQSSNLTHQTSTPYRPMIGWQGYPGKAQSSVGHEVTPNATLHGMLTASVVGPEPVSTDWILQTVLSPPESEAIGFDNFRKCKVGEASPLCTLRTVQTRDGSPTHSSVSIRVICGSSCLSCDL